MNRIATTKPKNIIHKKKRENSMAKNKNTTALATTSASTATIYQLDGAGVDLGSFKSLRVPIVKPREMPIGAFVVGEVKAVVDSPMKEFKSQLLVMQSPQGLDFKFPVTATVKRALEPNIEDFIGKTILIKKTGEAKGKTGKKMVHLFDVAVSEE